MNFNATLFGQMIAFAVFVWFCAKYIWPLIINAMEARRKQIADGLAAGEKGRQALELAEKKAVEILREGKEKSRQIVDQAQRRRDEIVEAAKDDAQRESERIISLARSEIAQDRQQAKEELRAEVSVLALAAAEQILMREVDKDAHAELLDKFSADL